MSASADELDNILKAGKLRCGVMLDFPPAGFRDAQNQPAGYDVDTCSDIATALKVTPEIVETQASQRVPALVSGRVDVLVASTTATLERAKTVTFSIPYVVYKMSVVVPAASPISSFDQLRGKTVTVGRGTTPESEYLARCKNWPEGCKNISVPSDAEQVLMLRQGRADALLEASSFTGTLVASEQGKGFKICCDMPGYTDWASIAVPRGELGFRDWLNLFIFHQVDSGRYAELYKKWFGAESAPALTVPGVYQ